MKEKFIKEIIMNQLFDYLKNVQERCASYFDTLDTTAINPPELKRGATDYFLRGGKRLRPAMMALCAGAVGGEIMEKEVLPAMVSVELFHTFTLIHDDIIDNDDIRRGGKSIHILVRDMFSGHPRAEEYGKDIAILAGDSLHALSITTLLNCQYSSYISPSVVLEVVRELDGVCLNDLLCGESVDTRLGLFDKNNLEFTDDILKVIDQKTGALFAYSARAGAMLGLNTTNRDDERVVSLGEFARLCGLAFQLKDDILGIMSDEKTLGKPIGSDIREGKKTIILCEAYKNATSAEKELLHNVVGVANSSPEKIEVAKNILIERGGVKKAERLAEEYICEALKKLEAIEKSKYTDLLSLVAEYMSARKL